MVPPLPQHATCHQKTKLVLAGAVPGATGPVCCQRALLISKSDCSEVWAGRPAAELSELSSMAAVRRRRFVPEGLAILFSNTAREEENVGKARGILSNNLSCDSAAAHWFYFITQLRLKQHSWILVLAKVVQTNS